MHCWLGAAIIHAAFAPDKGELVNTLVADLPGPAPRRRSSCRPRTAPCFQRCRPSR
ncbi:MAG TPA: hypothetical protein VJ735_12965 [Actinomycetes bacterium]|nr:hypothetical protein [Actinomycetes bacterium]